jgi:uncharacterized membrane protein YkvA (DUF1232 family)
MEIPDSEERGLEANPAEDTLPSTGLLSFYDRLRERILRAVERRGGRLGGAVAETLLLAPDVFMLLARLSLDKEVPKETRVLVSGALAYFLLPVDLLPEMVVGVGGYVDDVILALMVLSQSLGDDLAQKHWSGPQSVREVLRDVLGTAEALAGTSLYGRLKRYLARYGVDVEAAASAHGDGAGRGSP